MKNYIKKKRSDYFLNISHKIRHDQDMKRIKDDITN